MELSSNCTARMRLRRMLCTNCSCALTAREEGLQYTIAEFGCLQVWRRLLGFDADGGCAIFRICLVRVFKAVLRTFLCESCERL